MTIYHTHSRNQMYTIYSEQMNIALSFNFNFTASPPFCISPPHKNVVTSLSVSGHHWCAAPGWEVSGGSQQPSPLESHSLLPGHWQCAPPSPQYWSSSPGSGNWGLSPSAGRWVPVNQLSRAEINKSWTVFWGLVCITNWKGLYLS